LRADYIYPPLRRCRIITDIFSYTNENVPEWNTISISGYHMREGGCTACRRSPSTLSNGMTYVQAAIDAGLDVDKFALRLSFFFNAHSNFLEEVAKFRAARRMWARIMRDHFGAKNAKSWMLRFHTQTAGSTLTAQQPENNIVRTALQAMAAVLGGTQVSAYQLLRRSPGSAHRAVGANRPAHTADHRLRVGRSTDIDPLAGSYYVESLTTRLKRTRAATSKRLKPWAAQLRAMNADHPAGNPNLPTGVSSGRSQRSDRRRSERVPSHDEKPHPAATIDEALERKQVRGACADPRHPRPTKCKAAVKQVEDTARGTGNLMPVDRGSR